MKQLIQQIKNISTDIDHRRPVQSRAINALFSNLNKEMDKCFLTSFTENKPNAQDLSNAIYGLGELAKANNLNGKLNLKQFNDFLASIGKNKPNEQDISNTIYGLGELAKASQLSGTLDSAKFERLLDLLPEKQPTEQAISNAIYGLGQLAKASRLSGTLNLAQFERLSALLSEKQPKVQEVSNTIYGLAELAKAGRLDRACEFSCFEQLLNLLVNSLPNSQEISTIIYNLSQLANVGKLNRPLNQQILQALLKKSDLDNMQPFQLRQMVFSLSELHFSDDVLVNTIFGLLPDFSYIGHDNCVNILNSYALLSQNNVLEEAHFERLLSMIPFRFEQFNIIQQETLTRTIDNLNGDRRRRLENVLGLSLDDLNDNMNPVSSTFVASLETSAIAESTLPKTHIDVAEVIPGRVVFSRDHRRPQELVFHSSARSKMSHEVTPKTYVSEKERNAIFNAIAKKDLRGLELLLNIGTPSPRHTHINSKDACSSFLNLEPRLTTGREVSAVEIDNKRISNHLVSLFLERTNSEALNYLVQHSQHDYFERLLRACGKHEQYQFAIQFALHPILLHLPMSELNWMVSDLCKLGFYQDHRATLALIDALQVRKLLSQEESVSLVTLQHQLLDKAITYHGQHHRHVTAILLMHLNSLANQQQQLLDLTEMIDDLRGSPLPSTTPLIEAAPPSPTETVCRAVAFEEEPLMDSDETPNKTAYYSSETINKLLRLKLNLMFPEEDNVALFAPLDYNELPNGDVIKTRLFEYLGNLEGAPSTNMLFPININNHWVGLRIALSRDCGGCSESSSCRGLCRLYYRFVRKRTISATR